MLDGIQILSPGKGFPAGYLLHLSADGNAWVEIARVGADHAHDVFAVFAPQLVKYIQLDLLSASPRAWMISALLVHAATAWKATASHNPARAACALDNRDAVDVDFIAAQTQFINIQITAPAPRPWSIARARVLREMESWLGSAT